MSIIIPSASIYDKENQKVIKNNYSSISIKNDNIKESTGSYSINITNYSIERDDDNNITGITDVFYDSLGENSFYNNSVDGTFYLRYVGAYIAKGEYLLDLATAKISSISINCLRVYYTDSSRTTVHSYGKETTLSKEDVNFKFPTRLHSGFYSADQFVSETDDKLSGENDLAFSMARWRNYKRPNIGLIYYYWGDFGSGNNRRMFLDYLLVFFGFVSYYDFDEGATGEDDGSPGYAREIITSISITIEARKLEKEDNVQYSGDDNTRPFEMAESSLLTTQVYMQSESSKVQLAEWLVNRAHENYKDGKETATIRCSLVDYYNSDGVLEISPTNYSANNANTRMMFSVGDIVIPYVATPTGDRPMSLHPDGTPKSFRVTGVTLISDGAVWQELQLQEVSD